MKRIAAALAFASVLFLVPLRAEEPIDITFAVPDAGLITLGVFGKDGRLVRTLHRLATEKDFRVDINGYATRWDGKDDSGRKLPPGHYHLRGYLVANIKVEGEDFLFNDWIADDAGPKLSKILDFSLLENGNIAVLARDSSKKTLVARYSPDQGFLWAKDLPAATDSPNPSLVPVEDAKLKGSSSPPDIEPFLTTNDSAAVVFSSRSLNFFSLETGDSGPSKGLEGAEAPLALAARTEALFVASSTSLNSYSLPKWTMETIQNSPPGFKALAADSSRLIGANDEGLFLRKMDSSFQKLPLAAVITSVSLGAGDTFWFVGSEPGSSERIVAQASPAGEILRTLRPESGGPQPDKIRASRTAEKFATLESRPGLQRIRSLERGADGGWTIAWQRSIEDCSRFGFVDDRPVADVGEVKQPKDLTFRLEENPLTRKRETITLHAVFDKNGTRLVSADGLPLVEVSQRTDITRIVICRGNAPNKMRLLQGNGTVVEDFSIEGLNRIKSIDAGGVDLP